MAKNKTFKIHTLDVWGNESDGFDVNDIYPASDEITFNDFDDKKDYELIQQLIGAEVLRGDPIIDRNAYSVDDTNGDIIWIHVAETDKPVLVLRAA